MTQPLKRLAFTLFLLCAVGLLGALVLIIAQVRELSSATPGEVQTAQAGFATTAARQSSVNGKKANKTTVVASSGKSSNGNRESETELVQRLLAKIDSLPNVDPATKAKVREVLLATTADLASEKSSVHRERPAMANSAKSAPNRPSSGKNTSTVPADKADKDKVAKSVKSAEESRSDSQEPPQTAVVKALLDLLDQMVQDDFPERDNHQREVLRDKLMEADKTLRQYLGDAAKTRIQEANKRPTPPQVFNPKRRPAFSASSDESPTE